MAFFQETVLAKLHTIQGDIRGTMSLMATLTEVLVAAGVLSGGGFFLLNAVSSHHSGINFLQALSSRRPKAIIDAGKTLKAYRRIMLSNMYLHRPQHILLM